VSSFREFIAPSDPNLKKPNMEVKMGDLAARVTADPFVCDLSSGVPWELIYTSVFNLAAKSHDYRLDASKNLQHMRFGAIQDNIILRFLLENQNSDLQREAPAGTREFKFGLSIQKHLALHQGQDLPPDQRASTCPSRLERVSTISNHHSASRFMIRPTNRNFSLTVNVHISFFL
jgi:hypothetical protein